MSIGSTSINVNRVFGDLNEDGEVNIADLNLLVNLILKGGSGQEADQYVPNMTIAEFKAKHWQDATSYIDTVTANEIIHRGWIRGVEFTPQWIFNNLSRSYYNSLLGMDLNQNPELAPEGWFVDLCVPLPAPFVHSSILSGSLPPCLLLAMNSLSGLIFQCSTAPSA